MDLKKCALGIELGSTRIKAVLIDAFGLMESEKVPFGWGKFVGLGLMLGGVVLFKWK